jgi:tRNA-dihydrouridine synthase B
VQEKLAQTWYLAGLPIRGRLVLAPMAGVSVQAFRRQGRRFGAALVCTEMVSCAGLAHGDGRSLGYLRLAPDERPLAVQIFGSDPARMALGARMAEEAGADVIDINLGCPVSKVTKTGAGASLLEQPDLACRIVEAVAKAVRVPVTVKMRRGLADGSRACLELGPRLVEAGAAALTLHPRSARQMYRGQADHRLTAELVQRVPVPVIASGDVASRADAERVLAETGAQAVMVARAAQGNPWLLREIATGDACQPQREEVAAELVAFVRDTVRELGERRACGFLKKFYGWYLRRARFPKSLVQELVRLPSSDSVVRRLLEEAPGAEALAAEIEGERPPGDGVALALPISAYGGG